MKAIITFQDYEPKLKTVQILRDGNDEGYEKLFEDKPLKKNNILVDGIFAIDKYRPDDYPQFIEKYQDIISDSESSNLSEMAISCAITQLDHLEIIRDVFERFRLDPKYEIAHRKNWSQLLNRLGEDAFLELIDHFEFLGYHIRSRKKSFMHCTPNIAEHILAESNSEEIFECILEALDKPLVLERLLELGYGSVIVKCLNDKTKSRQLEHTLRYCDVSYILKLLYAYNVITQENILKFLQISAGMDVFHQMIQFIETTCLFLPDIGEEFIQIVKSGNMIVPIIYLTKYPTIKWNRALREYSEDLSQIFLDDYSKEFVSELIDRGLDLKPYLESLVKKEIRASSVESYLEKFGGRVAIEFD